jgi:hypothetical protein
VDVPNRDGYVYVRLRNDLSELIQAYNDSVSRVYDLPVLIERDPTDKSRYRVVSKDTGQYADWGANQYLYRHGATHSFNPNAVGSDLVWVFGKQFIPLLAAPSGTAGSGFLNIQPYIYNDGSDWKYIGGTGTSSFLGYKPTGAHARMVLLYIDDDGLPALEASASFFDTSITGTRQILPYIPNPPSDSVFPVGAVRLVSGTSTLSWSNLYDVRPFYTTPASGTAGGGGAPTDASYVVIGLDGDLSAERVLTGGTNITVADGGAEGNATVNVSPQGAGSSLDADTLDGYHNTSFASGTHTHYQSAIVDLQHAIQISEDGAFRATGTSIDFGTNMNVAVTGTSVFVSSIDTGGGGGGDLLIYDDRVFQVTGTAISFDDNLDVSVTGSIAYITATGATGTPGASGDNTLLFYDDLEFQATGTLISAEHGITLLASGTSIFAHSHAEYLISGTSNPPTESELIGILGSPSSQRLGQTWLLNDNGDGLNEYLIVDDGSNFWFSTLTKSEISVPALESVSTGTVATQAGQWFGRASLEQIDNVWVLCYREGSAHAVNDGELHIKFSSDYGATWTAEDIDLDSNPVTGFPMNPPDRDAGEDAGEPWLYLAPNGNLILHMWRVDYGVTLNGTYQSISTDNGKTWSTGTAINFSGIADDDKIFSTDDHFVLGNTIYAGARQYDNVVPDNSKSIFIKSEDSGETWEYVSDISNFTTDTWEVALEYLGGTTILALLRDKIFTATYKSVSADLGATWSALEDITVAFGNAVMGRARMMTRSHVKRFDDWWNDRILIVAGFESVSSGNSHPRRNAIWISQDAGITWTGPLYVDAQTEDAGYGDMLYNPNTNEYVFISYQGTLLEADLIQYNFRISGI